ncbi:MAG: ATPase, T2SS/T4P/T4SS family [Clostridia bacterium]|nr:ATPase, T2SS/T4P/T4SS family [Clostridia bacterium]
MANIPIGEVLKQQGYITEEQLQQALEYQREHKNKRIGEIVEELGFVTEGQKLNALAQRLSLPMIDIGRTDFDINAVGMIPRGLAEENNIIAYKLNGNTLEVITSDPLNMYGLEEVSQAVGMTLSVHLCEKGPILGAINFYYSEISAREAAKNANSTGSEEELEELNVDDGDGDAPIIRLVQSLIIRGYNTGASDIHIEPFEDKTLVRMRVDGVIVDYVQLQTSIHQSVIARIKIMSNLDIAEKRIPQDGHYKTKIDGQNVNIRISVIPTVYGEKAVLRILATKGSVDNAGHFGMNESDYRKFAPILNTPNGIVYITGPTGSGKSTTLYMILEHLSGGNVNISTIEDPVEKNVPKVNQMQVNNQSGLTFELGLRALLRQDPDIIMVGETRDNETASISVRAAITGHLVLSTLHTNDAISSIVRLRDMGVEQYLIANSLVGLVAQRLMRKVCTHCSTWVETSDEERAFFGRDIKKIRKPVGCPYCNNTGYNGRTAIHEIVTVDKGFSELISEGASVQKMTDYAKQNQGFRTLKESATDLVEQGVTTMEELIKVAYHSV